MAQFILLHGADDRRTYVNIDHIAEVFESKDKTTIVRFADDKGFTLIELKTPLHRFAKRYPEFFPETSPRP